MATTMMTRQHIANTLQTMMRSTSFSRITVASLCNACYISRKTFYYHFRDKFDLLAWIFQQECANVMVKETYPTFWDFYHALASYLDSNRSFYKSVFSGDGRAFFLGALRDFIQLVFSRYLGDFSFQNVANVQRVDCIDFLCTTFSASLEEWICHRPYFSSAEYVSLSRFDKIPC